LAVPEFATLGVVISRVAPPVKVTPEVEFIEIPFSAFNRYGQEKKVIFCSSFPVIFENVFTTK